MPQINSSDSGDFLSGATPFSLLLSLFCFAVFFLFLSSRFFFRLLLDFHHQYLIIQSQLGGAAGEGRKRRGERNWDSSLTPHIKYVTYRFIDWAFAIGPMDLSCR